MLYQYISSGLDKFKQYLIGDLNWFDIISALISQPIPTLVTYNLVLTQIRETTDARDALFVEVGLVGRLLKIQNIGLLLFCNKSTATIKNALNSIDKLPNARVPYNHFNDLTDTTQFITQTGTEAMHQRKQLLNILPKPREALATTIQIVSTAFEEKNMNLFSFFLEEARINTLVRQILVKLILGCDLTPQINTLIAQMTKLLVEGEQIDLKAEYHVWVHNSLKKVLEIIQDDSQSQLSSLAKEIINKNDPKPDIESLRKDPMIHALFTIISTANNIGEILKNSLFMHTMNIDEKLLTFREIREEMQSKNIDLTKASENCIEIIQMTTLNTVFKSGLDQSTFNPKVLYRFIDRETVIKGVRIPGNTQIIINHNTFSPFSDGGRVCPGKQLAEAVFKGIVCKVAAISPSTSDKLEDYNNSHTYNYGMYS